MAKLKDVLPEIPKEELAILRTLNQELSKELTEASTKDVAQAVKTIVSGWKGWSKAMLLALMLTPNIANALETYSPSTYNDIQTEISATDNKTAQPTTQVPGAIKTISFGENFASGKATLVNKDNLIQKVTEMKNFLNGKDASKFKVVIEAGESQVTNPKGFETKGSLAQTRAKEIEGVLSKLGFSNIDVQTKIGITPYKQGNDINDPKYQAEQFVTINIIANNDICSMQDISQDKGQGVATNDYVTYDDYISGTGELVLNTGQVPDRLVVLDANGNIKQDTGYITTQASKYKDWKYTPLYVLELTKAYKAKSKAMDGSKIKTITVTDYNDLVQQITNNQKPGVSGDEIGPALNEMRNMIQKGQKEFVIYDLGTSGVKVKFDQNQGEVQAKVYSPVGKTGYNIKGSCKR